MGGFGAAFELTKWAMTLLGGGADAFASVLNDIFDNIFKGFAADLLTESRRMWWIETPKAFVSEKVDGD